MTTNKEDPADFFRRLRALKAVCGSNKDDQAVVCISACIEEGWGDSGRRIMKTLEAIGFDPKHVGRILHDGKGHNSERHRWMRDEEGYHLHDNGS